MFRVHSTRVAMTNPAKLRWRGAVMPGVPLVLCNELGRKRTTWRGSQREASESTSGSERTWEIKGSVTEERLATTGSLWQSSPEMRQRTRRQRGDERRHGEGSPRSHSAVLTDAHQAPKCGACALCQQVRLFATRREGPRASVLFMLKNGIFSDFFSLKRDPAEVELQSPL